MMRSRRNTSRSLSEMIRDNPFLCLAFISGIALAAREAAVGSEAFMAMMWGLLGFGFHLTATLPQKLMPGVGPWLGIAMGLGLGLIPYLVLDVIWRLFKNR